MTALARSTCETIGESIPFAVRAWTSLSSRVAAIGPAGSMWFRLLELIDHISPFHPKPPAGGGPEGAPHDNPWDDPVIWLLMIL